jgi:hypothetical protein
MFWSRHKTHGSTDWREFCPYGSLGDRLWVRETWQQTRPRKSDGQRFILRTPAKGCGDLHYAADGEPDEPPKWRPSIYQPRWASRITLEVVSVRVERVQEITTADIRAEGVDDGYTNPRMGKRHDNGMRMAWEELWDSINAKRGYGWESNPWVWVITFKRLKAGEE